MTRSRMLPDPGVRLRLHVAHPLWWAVVLALGCGPGGGAGAALVDPEVSGLVFGEVIACEAPLPEVAWTEVGAAMGLMGNPQADYSHHHGGAAAVDDLDGDGDLDVVLSYPVGSPVLYLREGEGFAAGVSLPSPAAGFLLGLADVDGDGDVDLLSGGHKVGPSVLLNDGSAGFSPAELPELPENADRVRELAPGDLDGDGVVDIYLLANSGSDDPTQRADFLLRGLGGGVFEVEASVIPEELGAARGFDAIWFDLDGDLDQDLYVVNDDGSEFGGNVLYENRDGELVDVSAERSAGVVHFGMGAAVGDFDRDGQADLYLTAVEHSVLLQALPDGSFVNSALALGADPLDEWYEMGWGAIWLDFDNDGDLDILHAQGDRWADISDDGEDWITIVYEAPLDLLQQDDGVFAEVGADFGLAQEGSHRTLVAADHNGDGVLDLLATDVVAPPRFYLSDGCTEAGWLEVGAPPGTRVEVEVAGETQVHWVSTESSYGGAGPAIAHVGLGATDEVSRLVIRVPDGREFDVEGPFLGRRRVFVE